MFLRKVAARIVDFEEGQREDDNAEKRYGEGYEGKEEVVERANKKADDGGVVHDCSEATSRIVLSDHSITWRSLGGEYAVEAENEIGKNVVKVT